MQQCSDAACKGIFTDSATLVSLQPNATAFTFMGHDVGVPDAPFPWTPGTRYLLLTERHLTYGS